ncbi:MAG: alpha/beta hydrolase [Desulfovibrio sp.]|nr:alpha/beta hydrolase [Desulfovibrio sp.]MDE7240588.1 alpha/beta hydrolase [Desulfovibrio sp.]
MPPAPRARFQRLERNGHSFTLELWPKPGAGILLFYPGTMLSPRHYRTFLAALWEAGLAVAALHLEGHGVNPHRGGFTFTSLLDDGILAERWLHEAGLGPVAVCGHSQGGILAVAHAAVSVTLTAAFAICAILPHMPRAIELTRFAPFARQRDWLERAIVRLGRALPWLPVPLVAYLSLGRVLAGHGELHMARGGSRRTYPLGFLASLFSARIGTKLHCPFTLYNARDDALFTPSLALEFFNEIHAPQKTLVWLPDGGHLAPMTPGRASFMARDAAAACAGLGMTVRLEARDN